MASEPREKLDAKTELETAVAADGDVAVNGPEGETLDWDAVDWRQVEEDVRRLRQRIFAASQAGDLNKVAISRGQHPWPAREPSGTCLSRGAGKARKPGSEGAPAR